MKVVSIALAAAPAVALNFGGVKAAAPKGRAGVCASRSAQLPLAMAMLMRSRRSCFQRKAAQPLLPSAFSSFLRRSYSVSSFS